ncbi:MAG: dienelactone hydrolase family protein [Deltaproteobacteria bacterium]|nr:dienelactone hydrolase family protein [Deltaproteobacteria bacterium]
MSTRSSFSAVAAVRRSAFLAAAAAVCACTSTAAGTLAHAPGDAGAAAGDLATDGAVAARFEGGGLAPDNGPARRGDALDAGGGAVDAPSADLPDATPRGADGAGGLDAVGEAVTADAVLDGAADAPTAADVPTGELAATDASQAPGPTWDLPMIADPATANCAFFDKHTVFDGGQLLDVWRLTYQAWQYKDGALQPIPIAAFAARPAGNSKLPGVVLAHGLGGMAQEKHATELAARLGYFVIAYTGPGGGDKADNKSGGDPAGWNNGYKMFDTLADVRGSWFWGHAVAAMRAVTCLGVRPDVDADKLGITGFSAGGVVSLLAAGHDPRVKAAVPLSGTLAWAKATEAPKAWQHSLLQKAGLSIASPEWKKLQAELIDPAVALSTAGAKVLLVNGTTDEFFPLTAHLQTLQALPGSQHRTSLAANFDHGCYGVSGGEGKATIENRAKLRAEGGQKLWFAHWFGTDPAFGYVPQPPQPQVQLVGAATLLSAVVDPGGGKYDIDQVEFWASVDDAFLFVGTTLDCKGNVCSKLAAVVAPPNALYYADVQYKTKGLIPQKFSVSSPPVLPAGLVPKVRGIDTCL